MADIGGSDLIEIRQNASEFYRIRREGAAVKPRRQRRNGRVRLDPKDRPILLAAIQGKADFLLIGEGLHFGHPYGK